MHTVRGFPRTLHTSREVRCPVLRLLPCRLHQRLPSDRIQRGYLRCLLRSKGSANSLQIITQLLSHFVRRHVGIGGQNLRLQTLQKRLNCSMASGRSCCSQRVLRGQRLERSEQHALQACIVRVNALLHHILCEHCGMDEHVLCLCVQEL